eukprot:TRINITY_DN51259_c0_g1_i1.p1 TRINITY_DN51259_c0_g1~~TRINITY_DN51259_c0_g1_i1.p1  ORF type:complete len:344 (-),score=34.38 TRINITY_DN51259_c0_g1_i1:74-1105(-)
MAHGGKAGAADVRDEFSLLLRAGTIGSVAMCVICTPLDVVRSSAQAGFTKRKPPLGLREAFRSVWEHPGVGTGSTASLKNLYRGLPASVAVAALAPGAFLLAYEPQRGYKQALEAGIIARMVQSTVVQPLDFARMCRQASVGMGAAAHLDRPISEMVYAGDGFRSLWRGLIPTVCRDASACLGLWVVYSGLRDRVCGITSDQDGIDEPPPAGSALRCAALASVGAAAAAIVSQPFDVVKTRMQVHQVTRSDKSGFKKVSTARVSATFIEAYKVAGVRGLWVGGLARTLKAAFGGFLLGPLFEYCHLVADDCFRPLKNPYIMPANPSGTIVHPRASQAMFIEVR